MSIHANIRAQQRGIPPLIDLWLDMYGHEEYSGSGTKVVYFDKKSRRAMERDMGREPIRKCEEWLNAYKVVDSHQGQTITLGHRFKRVHRK